MLEKIHTIENIGLFAAGTPSPAEFQRVTLIYAENGRGKSTLSAILRAASENDSASLLARRTLDTTGVPRIGMQVAGRPVKFENNAWTQPLPEFVVFDSEFVERNVYSGSEIRPDQRQSLLEFAIGDTAVSLKRDVDRITNEIAEANRRKTTSEAQITGFRRGMPLREFRDLEVNPNCDKEIEDLKIKIAVARQQQGIMRRPDPASTPLIDPDLTQFLGVLAGSMEGMEGSAEAKVKEHLSKHPGIGIESWVSQGQKYITGDDCPFCSQNLAGIELIRAYKVHFNTAYNELKEKVRSLSGQIDSMLPQSLGQTYRELHAKNLERIAAWSDQFQITPPSFNDAVVTGEIEQIRRTLLDLAGIKSNSPLERLDGGEQIADVHRRVEVVNLELKSYNAKVQSICETFTKFKQSLGESDIPSMESLLQRLETQKARHTEPVLGSIRELDSAENLKNQLEQQKVAARGQLDQLMEATLNSLLIEINKWLVKFGASFSIIELKPDYQGGGIPRSKFALRIRGKSVALGSRGASSPVFANTLSEGDKRSLAFAFFLSRLRQRQDLAHLVVVVDDPVTSFDRNRRSRTKDALAELSQASNQIIVLAHDAFFLRDLERFIREKARVQTKVLEVRRAQNEYSEITDGNIEEICLSDYHQHYLCVREFVEAGPSSDSRKAAMALRTLVEGHLHRRFPFHLKPGVMLGSLITEIEQADQQNPMVVLKPHVRELRALNGYASKYHHDTNPSPESEPISDAELLTYCKQGLQLIHTGAL